MVKKKKILILGAGSGGIAVAARLNRTAPNCSITILDPAEYHYYQPLWTLVGAGLAKKEKTQRRMRDLIPSGVDWRQEAALHIDPKAQEVHLDRQQKLPYDYLVIATGLKLDWDKIEGLGDRLGSHGICSIYQYDQVDYTAYLLGRFQSGKAIFVMPPTPIKCAGAPQKIMYLAEHLFRKKGIRQQSEVVFATAGKAMFGIPTFAEPLSAIAKERGIVTKFQHRIKAVEPAARQVYFDVTDESGQSRVVQEHFDLLHLVPTMSAPKIIEESALAVTEGDQKGWLAVDKFSLQHLHYPNIFGIGDVTGIPNSKTGAAIRKQYPVLVDNLKQAMQGKSLTHAYDGYSSCPLITEIGKVMLAEFGYDAKIMASFPFDPTISRRRYWYLKKNLIPLLYWHGMMKGLA